MVQVLFGGSLVLAADILIGQGTAASGGSAGQTLHDQQCISLDLVASRHAAHADERPLSRYERVGIGQVTVVSSDAVSDAIARFEV